MKSTIKIVVSTKISCRVSRWKYGYIHRSDRNMQIIKIRFNGGKFKNDKSIF